MKHIKLFEKVDKEKLKIKLAKASEALKRKARKAGYDIGDLVYNRIMNKNIIIVSDYGKDDAPDDVDRYCTLGAVGENLDVYSLVKKRKPVNKIKASEYNDRVDKLYDEVIDLIRSPKFQKLNQDDYYKLGIKLKQFFNKNIIE